jgi:hypothetical protein
MQYTLARVHGRRRRQQKWATHRVMYFFGVICDVATGKHAGAIDGGGDVRGALVQVQLADIVVAAKLGPLVGGERRAVVHLPRQRRRAQLVGFLVALDVVPREVVLHERRVPKKTLGACLSLGARAARLELLQLARQLELVADAGGEGGQGDPCPALAAVELVHQRPAG